MQSLKSIKKRISSVNSTKKVTGAMKMIAASGLRAVQDSAVRSREYSRYLKEMALQVAHKSGDELHQAFELRKVIAKADLIVITPERGFCGGLSEQLYKQLREYIRMMEERGTRLTVFVSGRNGANYFRRQKVPMERLEISADDPLAGIKMENLSRYLLQRYLKGDTDQVVIAYHGFISAAQRQVTLDMLLPIWVKEASMPRIGSAIDFIYEPDKKDVFTAIIAKHLRTFIYQAMLEAKASELSARIIAMTQATKNAEDMVKALKRKYNSVRQSAITRELMDIVGGAEVLNG